MSEALNGVPGPAAVRITDQVAKYSREHYGPDSNPEILYAQLAPGINSFGFQHDMAVGAREEVELVWALGTAWLRDNNGKGGAFNAAIAAARASRT